MHNKTWTQALDKFVSLGVDEKLSYVEKRKVKLINVITYSLFTFLVFFTFLNFFQKRYLLLIGDLASITLVCIPALYLQYKKKYTASKFLIVSSFFVLITFFSIVQYDADRHTEHLLLGTCIIPIFLFEGWKKNLLFLLFVAAFFLIKIVNIIQYNEPLRIETYYIIYAITFLSVYVIASYFKRDVMNFNNKLQESNETKDKLFKIIAHDIKNPFNSLLGVSDLQMSYLNSNNKEKIKNSANIINESSNRIYMLAETLLDWSIAQSEGFKINIQSYSIKELIRETVELCQVSAKNKSIDIVLQNNDNLICKCDKIMTQIAVRNILMNAIKYSPPKSKIIIDYFIDNNNLEIRIEDCGIGMNKTQVADIFDSSKRISQMGTENEKGTGIGLKMSNELIILQGGTITAESTPNEGSTFIIILPCQNTNKII